METSPFMIAIPSGFMVSFDTSSPAMNIRTTLEQNPGDLHLSLPYGKGEERLAVGESVTCVFGWRILTRHVDARIEQSRHHFQNAARDSGV